MVALFAVGWMAIGCGGRPQGGLPQPPVPVTVTPASGGGSPAPVPSTTPLPTVVVGGAIEVALPRPGAEVKSPVRVEGRARVFEGNVQVQLRNSRGMIIGNGFATASAGAPEWGTFNTSVSYALTGGSQGGMLEVFSTSPRDGRVENSVSIPVVLMGSAAP